MLMLIICLIIFIPFPVKIRVNYIDGILSIKLYNFEVNLGHKKQEKAAAKLRKDIHPMEYLKRIEDIRFKMSLRLHIDLLIGFDDAAKTAEIFGIANYSTPFVFMLLEKLFNIKKYTFNIKPNFKENIFQLKINSIIWISIAKTIYILACLISIMAKTKIKYDKLSAYKY